MNFDEFLLKVTDHNGDLIEIIVKAENSNEAVIKFLQKYDGSRNIKKIEVSLPLLIV